MNKANFIAPSFRYLDKEVVLAVENVRSLGYDLILPETKLKTFRMFAARPKKRTFSVNSVFRDSSSQLVFAIKGGYGALEILPTIDYDAFELNKKKLFGFSDITAILNAVYQKTGVITYHAPNAGSIGRSFTSLEKTVMSKLINGDSISYSLKGKKTRNTTKSIYRGKSAGGNLVIMCDLLGTEYQVDCKDKIVFLECQATKGYRIYVKLVQLYLSGSLKNCSCVVLGHFRKCNHFTPKYIDAFFKNYPVPVVWWEDYGHGSPNNPFPIGAETIVDLEKGILIFNQ